MKEELKRLDAAVDKFAAAMKARLHEKAQAGYTGWDDPTLEPTIVEDLRNDVLESPREHTVDIGCRAMMVWLHREREEEGWRVIGDYTEKRYTEIRHAKAWQYVYAQYTYGPVQFYAFGENVRKTQDPPAPRKDEPIWTVLDKEMGGSGIALDEVTFDEALEYVRNKMANG